MGKRRIRKHKKKWIKTYCFKNGMSLRYYKKYDAGENPYAYVALGYNYCYGRGVDADQEKGKEYFDNAIALGCMDGYYGLGQIAFDEGDYTTAMEDYEMAAENGTETLGKSFSLSLHCMHLSRLKT